MRFKLFKSRSSRGKAPTISILFNLLKVFVPLLFIGFIAFWFLNYKNTTTGSLKVKTSVPGADILIGGIQTPFMSDTTIQRVEVGRKIITVRKQGYISEPEVQIVEIKQNELSTVNFSLKSAVEAKKIDSIPPLRQVRQEVLSTGQPVRSVPPVYYQSDRFIDVLSNGKSEPVTKFESVIKSKVDEQDLLSQLDIKSEQKSEKNPEVSKSLQGTEISVTSIPDSAEIIVNGRPTPHFTPYVFYGLDRGVYDFAVRKEGYLVNPEKVSIALSRDQQNELLAFELQLDKSKPQPTLTVSTVPLAAGIRLDGKAIGIGKATKDIALGKHLIEFVDVPGYKTPDPVEIVVAADNLTNEVNGAYQKLEGNSFIAFSSSDEDPALEGKLLRVYIDNELVIDGPKKKFNATILGKIAAGNRSVKVQYGEVSEVINVNLTDGQVSEISLRVESFFSKRKLKLREKDGIPLAEWQKKTRRLTVLNLS